MGFFLHPCSLSLPTIRPSHQACSFATIAIIDQSFTFQALHVLFTDINLKKNQKSKKKNQLHTKHVASGYKFAPDGAPVIQATGDQSHV
jgi:hypothetical protein